MDQIFVMTGLAFGGLALFLIAVGWARRARGKSTRKASDPCLASEPMNRRLELRIDEIEARLEAQAQAGAPEERLRDMAGSLVGLIRDKNATLETALAGLDQLRARLRALEQMGDLAEARGLYAGLGERIDALQSSQAAAAAALEERIAGLRARAEAEATPQAALAEQFGLLRAQKDAGIAAVLDRLAPLEARLTGLETERAGAEPAGELARETLARLGQRVETLGDLAEAARAGLAALRAEIGAGPVAEIAARLEALFVQKETLWDALLGRIAALEEGIATRDPCAALDRLAERLEALRARVETLETPGESPFAEISEQLTRLYAQKDSAVEVVFARLAPLEAKLAEIEQGLAARDPRAALDAFASRLEAAQELREAAEAGLRDRVERLEAPAENPFAAISEQLAGLYAQKDSAVELVFTRLAPLEAKLAEIEQGFVGALPRIEALEAGDPRPALAALSRDITERMTALRGAQGAAAERISALGRALGTASAQPFAAISEQLTRLYAQQEAGAVAVLDRLAPLETRLAALEARPTEQEAEAASARAEAQAIATQMIAARAAAEQTELFANRLALLEASLPRVTADRAEAQPPCAPDSARGADLDRQADLAAVRGLSRVICLYHGPAAVTVG